MSAPLLPTHVPPAGGAEGLRAALARARRRRVAALAAGPIALLGLLIGRYVDPPGPPAHWLGHPAMRVAKATESRVSVRNGIALELARRQDLLIYLIDVPEIDERARAEENRRRS